MRINQLALREEDKKVSLARAKSMLKTYRDGEVNKDTIEKFYSEWTEVASRLKKGAELLDQNVAVQEASKIYLRELEDLYKLLLSMLGMYDELFKKMFENHPDRYRRAQSTILEILAV